MSSHFVSINFQIRKARKEKDALRYIYYVQALIDFVSYISLETYKDALCVPFETFKGSFEFESWEKKQEEKKKELEKEWKRYSFFC